MPLGLENLVAVDRAELTDGAIDGTDKIGVVQRTRACLERTSEEVVEGGVAGDVWLRGIGHVDAVPSDEPADDRGSQRAEWCGGEATGESREGLLGKQVLREDGEWREHAPKMHWNRITRCGAR